MAQNTRTKLDWHKLDLSSATGEVAKAVDAYRSAAEAQKAAKSVIQKAVEASLVKAKAIDTSTQEVVLGLRFGIDSPTYAISDKAAKSAASNGGLKL